MEQAEVEFISDRHGYALQLPDGRWDVIELPGTWAPASAFDDAGVDSISLDGRLHAPSVKFSSQPLAEGATFEEWLADYDAAFSRQFPCEMLSHESADVAGEPARVARYLCNDGWIAVEAVLFYDERAYGIRVDGPIIPYGREHREVLDEWIARLEFIDSGG